jgi:alkylhydroperoxidase/carboxymuconolactone decarboxylase family protein YurZ
MAKDYVAIADSVVTGANKLAKAVPDAMGAFGALGKASYGEGKLSAQTKELISLAISVAVNSGAIVGQLSGGEVPAVPE